MSTKSVIVFGLAALASAGTFALSMARAGPLDFNFDQRNGPNAAAGGISIKDFSPLGQEFTPKLNKVEIVTLALEYGGLLTGQYPGTFEVQVRKDTITGDLLGTSMGVDLPRGFGGSGDLLDQLVQFSFAQAVPLTPGQRDVLQLVQTAGTSFTVEYSGDLYPGGRMVQSGQPVQSSDLIFWEGVKPNPEPASFIMFGLGMLGLLAYGWRHRKPAGSPTAAHSGHRCNSPA
jgi:hypothetical protein